MISITRSFLIALVMLAFGQALGFAQQTVPSPVPSPRPAAPSSETSRQIDQEPIRTLTEEVQLTVTALDSQDRLDPTLELADILVLEDGVAQEIRSARRVPAHILLLLDTGGELNSAKRVRLTREIARRLVSALEPQDEVSVMQFNNKVEILQNWTIDRSALLRVLDTKLLSGKRARFFDAVLASAAQFNDRPPGNRHVVMITDGVQSAGERVDRAAAFKQLQASNAVVHVISYTSVSRQTMEHQRRPTRKRDKSIVPDEVIDSLPPSHDWDPLRGMHEPGGIIADLDPERRKQIKDYEDAMRVSEKQLTTLSDETGGRIWLPESFEAMIDDGTQAARLIDSQYVVTYKPRRALASARDGETRRIDVASRRVGLKLVSRRQYFVPSRNAPANQGRARRVNN